MGGILLKPVTVVDRVKSWEQALEGMASVHAKRPPNNNTPLEQEEENAEMIKAFQRARAADRP